MIPKSTRRSSLFSWPALATILALTVFGSSLVIAFNGGATKATAVALPITPPIGVFTGDNSALTTPPVVGAQKWHNVTWWTWTPPVTMTMGVRATSRARSADGQMSDATPSVVIVVPQP